MIYFFDHQRALFPAFVANRRKAGLPMELLDADEARARCPILPDDITHTHQFGVVRGHPHRQVPLVDLEDQVGHFRALDRTGFDLLDASSPMVGVDDRVADLESHVAHTPSATPMLPRRTLSNGLPWRQTCRSRRQLTDLKEMQARTGTRHHRTGRWLNVSSGIPRVAIGPRHPA